MKKCDCDGSEKEKAKEDKKTCLKNLQIMWTSER